MTALLARASTTPRARNTSVTDFRGPACEATASTVLRSSITYASGMTKSSENGAAVRCVKRVGGKRGG